MEQAVNRETHPAHERLEEDDPSGGSQHPERLFEKGARSAQMMENIQQNEMRNAAIRKRQLISITDHIDPRIWEQIGREGLWEMGLEVADARTDLHDPARRPPINEMDD